MGCPGQLENAETFRCAGARADRGVPEGQVVTVSECASHAVVDAEIGAIASRGSCERALARRLHARLEDGWLLIADRGLLFESWKGAAASGVAPAMAGEGGPGAALPGTAAGWGHTPPCCSGPGFTTRPAGRWPGPPAPERTWEGRRP